MRNNKITLVLSLVTLFIAAASALAQNETFSAPNVDYSFVLPDTRWKQTVKPSDTSPNVEYVFNDRIDGHLEVRRITAAKDDLNAEVIQQEEQKLQFLPGYVAGRQESFAGRFKGSIFNYEYARAGRLMSGRMYFLRVDDTTFYVLRFTGQKDSLRSITSQTDSIARTFDVKKK